MKLIGYWMQDLHDTQLPLPHELVGPMAKSVRNALCRYLRSGEVFSICCGLSWCRFKCGASPYKIGCAEFTDGEWVWPEGLAHYVRAHSVVLPDEFIATAMSGRPAAVSRDRSATLDFWIDWAAKHQSPVIRVRLQRELAKADLAKAKLVERLIEEIREQEHEGESPCLWAGCSRKALKGSRICARHCFNDTDIESRTAHLYMRFWRMKFLNRVEMPGSGA